jgi:hypothetical protein
MRSSSVPKRLPSSSRRSSTQSTSNTPANAPEATIGGVNRAPSSLVQHTSSSGRLVRTRRSSRVRSTSSPASTPTMPSYLPPANWVSRWLPIRTGGRWSSTPGRRAKMLPRRSTVTVQPASVHQVMKRSRISLSASVRARRRRPPALPGPISPERITVDQKRGASMPNSSLVDMALAPPRRAPVLPCRARTCQACGLPLPAHGEGSAGRPRCLR